MYYGYIGYSRSTAKVYVITGGHITPEAAEEERSEKVKALPRGVYLANYFLSHGVLKCPEPIEIPAGYWGVAV
jgi:predicted O-linked N-acetylglucosamine transferase (SPINDLY family)